MNEAQKNPKALRDSERHSKICEEFKRLIDLGSDTTAAIKYMALHCHEFLGETVVVETIWKNLRKAGLTGPNGYKKQLESKKLQPA